VVVMAAPDLLKGGYIKHMPRWMEYAGFHLPHKVKRLGSSKVSKENNPSEEGRR